MKHHLDELPIFNGRKLSVLNSQEGQWWVAIKPICEGLGVQYNRAFANLKEDEILGQLLAEQLMVAADGRLRKMTCLPEKFVYGWLFSIRSDSPELLQYKRTCYEVLYDFFHTIPANRIAALQKKTALQLEILALEEKLQETEEYRKIQELKQHERKINTALRGLDKDIMNRQLQLFPQTTAS